MTQDPSTLQNLLTRVEAAGSPDRAIDVAIARATGLLTCWQSKHGYFNFEFDGKKESTFEFYYTEPTDDRWPPSEDPLIDISYRLDIPEYTASIDAALALVERVLPGYEWAILKAALGGVYTEQLGDIIIRQAIPLAILAALLKALIAQAGETA